MTNEASMNRFFTGEEELQRYRGGFKRDKLPIPWNDACLVIMKYLTLEGRFGVYYYYHFPLLNHFRNRDFISIPFFLLHSLEDMISDIWDKRNKGANYAILHQGLIFRSFQFHLALCPPRVIAIENHLPPQDPSCIINSSGIRVQT